MNCPDCNALVGEDHYDCCDVQICPVCGRQALSCGMHEISNGVYYCETTYTQFDADERLPWAGEYPEDTAAREHGFFCLAQNHRVECEADHPDAIPDENRLYRECRWDRAKHKLVKKE